MSNGNTPQAYTLEIQEWKDPDLVIPNKPKKENNQSDANFDMEVFEWKEKAKNVFVRRWNKEEGKN